MHPQHAPSLTIQTLHSSPDETLTAPFWLKTRPKFKFSASPHLLLASSLVLLAPLGSEAGVLGFSTTALSVSEDEGAGEMGIPLEIRLAREVNDYGSCTFRGTLGVAGTATQGADYTLAQTNFNVTLGAEDSIQTTSVALNIVDDTALEDKETIALSLTNVTHDCGQFFAVNISPMDMTIEIIDNDQDGEPQNFRNLARTSPQRAVGTALDQLCATSTSVALQQNCSGLGELSADEKRAALQQIAPEEIAIQGTLALGAGTDALSNLRNRLNTLRALPAGQAPNTFALQLAGADPAYQMLANRLMQQLDAAGTAPGAPPLPSPWSVYITGTLGDSAKKSTTLTPGFDADTYGMLVGADYRINNQWFAGSALNFTTTRADLDSNAGDMEHQSTVLALYSSYYIGEKFYLDGVLHYGKENFDSVRILNYLGDAKITGKTNGNQFSASIGGGIDAYPWDWNFNTYARATYVAIDIDKFDERGTTGWELQIGKQSVKSLATVLGMRVTKSISTSAGVFTPGAHFEWQHELDNDAREFSALFLEDPSVPFALETDNPDRDAFNVGAGVVATLPGGRTAFLQLTSVHGQALVTQRRIDLGFRMEF